MWNAFATCDGSMSGVEFGSRLRVDLLVFERRVGNRPRHGIEHDPQEMHEGGDLIGRQVIQQMLRVLFI